MSDHYFDLDDGFDIDVEAEPPEDVLPDQLVPTDWVEDDAYKAIWEDE